MKGLYSWFLWTLVLFTSLAFSFEGDEDFYDGHALYEREPFLHNDANFQILKRNESLTSSKVSLACDISKLSTRLEISAQQDTR